MARFVFRKVDPGVSSNRLEFMFTTYGFPRNRASFFARNSGGVEGFKFRVGMLGIVEFNDTGAEGFDAGDRPYIVRKLNFVGRGSEWSNIACSTAPVNTIDTRSCNTYFTVASTGEKVTLTMTVAEGYVRDSLNNRTLLPNGPKWDILLENLVYSFPTTKFAIILALDSFAVRGKMDSTDAPVDTTQPEGTITVGLGGRFNWVKKVQARWLNATRNRNADMISSSLFSDTTTFDSTSADETDAGDADAAESRQLIAFTPGGNDQPTSILWDPSVLVDDSGAFKASVPVLLIFSLVAIIVSFF